MSQCIVRAFVIAAVVCAVSGTAQAGIRPSFTAGGQATSAEWWPVAREAQPETGPVLLAQWGALPPVPPEQRQQMRQQMREHWQQMPPEQREGRRQEGRDHWQQMPSDERQRIREEMRERGGYGEGRHRR